MKNADPFTIRIFVPDGDPEGVRIIDRLNCGGDDFVELAVVPADRPDRRHASNDIDATALDGTYRGSLIVDRDIAMKRWVNANRHARANG